MRYFLILVVLSSAIFSCASLRKNAVLENTFIIRGTISGDNRTSAALSLKRYSWYQELNLLFDLYITTIEPNSPFYAWFSKIEKNELDKCTSFFIAATYNMEDKKISQADFLDQVRRLGYEKVSIPQFAKALYLHPDSQEKGFSLYQINAYCNRGPFTPNSIQINFPLFLETNINL